MGGLRIGLALTALLSTPKVPSLPAATFTVSNPAFVDYQQFARTTKTGGYANKGTATIPAWPINVTTAGAIYARLVARGDPNRADGTVIQDAWQLAASVQVGTASIDVTGCGCGAAWFQVQLSGSAAGPWQSAPNPVKLGVGVAVLGTGQSLVQVMANTTGAQAFADAGVTANPYASIFQTALDPGNTTSPPPAWQPASQGGAGIAQLADRLQAALGVNVIVASHSHGAINAANLLKTVDGNSGSDFAFLTAIMDGIKAWEYTWWFQGHTDSAQGMGGRAYQCYLRWFFGYAAFKNFWGKATRGLTMGIPNANGWGTDAQKNEIRSAGYRWAKSAEAAAGCTNGSFYANLYNLQQVDGVHPNAPGCKQLGNLVADAFINGADAPAGDDALGALIPSSFAAGTGGGVPAYAGAGKFVASALSAGTVALNDTPPIGPNTTGVWIKNGTGNGVPLAVNNSFYVIQNGGTLYLSAGGNQQQTGGPKLTDNGADWHYLSVEYDRFPYDQTKQSTITMKIDGVAIPGATAIVYGSPVGNLGTVRAYNQGGDYGFDPSVCSEFTVYNRLNVPVPTGAVTGTEVGLYAATALNGSSASLL